MRKYFPLLKQTALFQGITDAELEAIFSCQAPRFHQYAKQDYLFHMGEYTHAIGIVLEGSVTILTEDFGVIPISWPSWDLANSSQRYMPALRINPWESAL